MRSKAPAAGEAGGVRRKKRLAAPAPSRDAVLYSARTAARAASRVIAAHDKKEKRPADARTRAREAGQPYLAAHRRKLRSSDALRPLPFSSLAAYANKQVQQAEAIIRADEHGANGDSSAQQAGSPCHLPERVVHKLPQIVSAKETPESSPSRHPSSSRRAEEMAAGSRDTVFDGVGSAAASARRRPSSTRIRGDLIEQDRWVATSGARICEAHSAWTQAKAEKGAGGTGLSEQACMGRCSVGDFENGVETWAKNSALISAPTSITAQPLQPFDAPWARSNVAAGLNLWSPPTSLQSANHKPPPLYALWLAGGGSGAMGMRITAKEMPPGHCDAVSRREYAGLMSVEGNEKRSQESMMQTYGEEEDFWKQRQQALAVLDQHVAKVCLSPSATSFHPCMSCNSMQAFACDTVALFARMYAAVLVVCVADAV